MIGPILLALLLVVGDIVVRATRIRVLLGDAWPRGIGGAIAVNAYGDAASAVTPARLGGEPARFLALRRRNVATPAALVVLGTERIVDMGLAAVVTAAAVGWLGTSGFGDVRVLVERFRSPRALPWVVAVAVLVIVFAGVAVRFRHRFPREAEASFRDALAHLRTVAGPRLLAAIGLTAASMSARVAILPVLLWGAGALGDPLTTAIGSFGLIYAQLLLPIPAGAGGVELGFVVGLAPHLDAATLTKLLVIWRVLTLGIPAGLGGAIFLRRRLGGGAGG